MAPFSFQPAASERWPDLESLPGKTEAQCGLLVHVQGDGNRQILKQMVEAGGQPGIPAYDGDRDASWCASAPADGQAVDLQGQ